MGVQTTLPNSIPRAQKVDYNLSSNGMEWLFLYCSSCGVDGGRVLKTDVPKIDGREFAFYLCDPCAVKYGAIDGTAFVPDELFFQKVVEAQMEREGRILEIEEVAVALDNPDHYLSKLVKNGNTFLASE